MCVCGALEPPLCWLSPEVWESKHTAQPDPCWAALSTCSLSTLRNLIWLPTRFTHTLTHTHKGDGLEGALHLKRFTDYVGSDLEIKNKTSVASSCGYRLPRLSDTFLASPPPSPSTLLPVPHSQWRDAHARQHRLLHEEAPQRHHQLPPGKRASHQHCEGRGQPLGQVRGRRPHAIDSSDDLFIYVLIHGLVN